MKTASQIQKIYFIWFSQLRADFNHNVKRNGNDKFVVHYLDEKRKVFIKDGDTILATSLKFKINHQHVCGGNARCSSCRILVSEGLGNCLPRNKMELAVARTLMLNKNIRLACQTLVVGDVTISRPPFDELDVKIATLAIAEGSNYRKGQDKELSIMFVDIENFTPLVERMPACDVMDFLNKFYYLMGNIVEKHNAKIIDYYGDGFLSVFGIERSESKEWDSVLAGREMFETIRDIYKKIEVYSYPKMKIRIGIKTGQVIVGTIGTEKLRKLAVMGDPVNVAKRIESKNKDLKTHFLICNETYKKISGEFASGKMHKVTMKGLSGKHKLWEVRT